MSSRCDAERWEADDRWLIDLERCQTDQEIAIEDTFGDPITTEPAVQRGAPWALRRVAETSRCDVIVASGDARERLTVDEGLPFRFVITIDDGAYDPAADGRSLVVGAALHRDDEVIESEQLSAVFESGLAFVGAHAVRVTLGGAPFEWALALRGRRHVEVAAGDATRFLRKLLDRCRRGSYHLPASLPVVEEGITSVHVRVHKPEPATTERGLSVDVSFDYGPTRVPWRDVSDRVLDDASGRRRVIARDADAEQSAIAELLGAGVRWPTTMRGRTERGLTIAASRLTRAILALPADRYVVEADGVVMRQATSTSFRVETNIDWFDLEASVDFGGLSASMPALLKAARRGEHLVRLGDGSIGILPEEWLALFDFLNPGMLGSGIRATARRGFGVDGETAARIGRGLRPFVLQRKKAEVLTELPPRIDQTIRCVMEDEQRAQYDRVKKYYQKVLLTRCPGDEEPSRFVVLEALLRLRQIACHPGLVDPELAGRPSAKIDALLEHLEPIVRQRKKALVFSQFTSLLDIAGRALDTRGIRSERLDGSTADRRGVVERFQASTTCSVFLVSLKAGGVGLNLTAAEYVFILDPWWNPAVEAQAVDRAHRLGQTKPVVAYRLLCHDTIEDRVAELQAKKRELVTSVFSETEGMRFGSLSASDVESLLA